MLKKNCVTELRCINYVVYRIILLTKNNNDNIF